MIDKNNIEAIWCAENKRVL